MSTGVSSRDASSCMALVGYVIAATIVLAIIVFVLPPVAVLACVYMWTTRSRAERSGAQLALVTIVAAVGVGVAAWAWPTTYASYKYGVNVPASSFSESVGDYQDKLATAGFQHVDVVLVDKNTLPKSVADCAMESVSPAEGNRTDIRDVVVVTADCAPLPQG